MQHDTALDALYTRFARIWADGVPIVGLRALDAAIAALGMAPDDVTDAWLRSLDRAWVYGERSEPFHDEGLNRRYLQLIAAGRPRQA